MQRTANDNAAGIWRHRHLHLVDDWPINRLLHYLLNLQNRRNFVRILGEQRRKRGESEARVEREGRKAKKFKRNNCRSSPRTRLAFRARLDFASVRLKYAKTLRLFCRLLLATTCWRDLTRSKHMSTVAIIGFQFGLYQVVIPWSFLRSISLASLFTSLVRER